MLVRNRTEGGAELAERLVDARLVDPVVLGLPRGGVAVASAVAQGLHAILDVIVVRKLGVPRQRELAMGAVGEGGIRVLDPDAVSRAHVDSDELAAVESRERQQVAEQAALFRGGRPFTALSGRTVVLVDDGIATGATMLAACQIARAHHPARLLVAVPVAPASQLERVREGVDEVVCLHTPHPFMAVGLWYHNFDQVTNAEVVALLRTASPDTSGPT